jgi:predicted MFS family arabinose efflux permease
MAIGLNVFGGLSGLAVFFITGLPVGMILSIVSVYAISMMQRFTPHETMGRVMSIVMAVCQCAVPIGQVLFGLLFNEKSAGVLVPILIVAAATLVIAIVGRLFFVRDWVEQNMLESSEQNSK